MSDLELQIIVAPLDFLLVVVEVEDLLLQPAAVEDLLFALSLSLLQSRLQLPDPTLSLFVLLRVLILMVDGNEVMTVFKITDLQLIFLDLLIQCDIVVHFLLGELARMILLQIRDLSF